MKIKDVKGLFAARGLLAPFLRQAAAAAAKWSGIFKGVTGDKMYKADNSYKSDIREGGQDAGTSVTEAAPEGNLWFGGLR